ncbi:MAG: ABC-type transport auxiliary lipoprotein family protein [Brachymonas sp.]|nr:ABC-type transport auxiliary lipoprotein family protein [Brachymonas sp.]
MTRAPTHLHLRLCPTRLTAPGPHPLPHDASPDRHAGTVCKAEPPAARFAPRIRRMRFTPFVRLATRLQRTQATQPASVTAPMTAAIATSFARWAAALGASSLITACSILPAATPVDTYVLPSAQPLPATATSPAANSPALRIARPVANGVLAGKRIVVMPQADRLQVYQGAVWNEAPPQLLRNRLLDAFMADGRLPTVDTDEGPSAQVDYLLASQLRDFHSVYENGSALPTAIIRLDAQLIHTGSNRIVASRSFVVKQPTAIKEVPAVVQALGQAADQMAKEVVDWAAARVQSQAMQTTQKNLGQ